MNDPDLSLFETIQSQLNHWWLVVLFMVVGGFGGWLFHTFTPPVYEAKAVLTLAIDHTASGELTEYQQDLAIHAAQGILASTSVLEKTLADASSQQIHVGELKQGENFFLERKGSHQELRVRDRDPETAAVLANLLARNANTALAEAHWHAVSAYGLRLYLTALQSCPEVPQVDPPLPDLCQSGSFEEAQAAIQKIDGRLQEQLVLSRGVSHYIMFDLSQEAVAPDEPVAYRQNYLVLAGALLGFILSVGANAFRGAR